MPESQTSHYHVFLSHNSRDKVAVELLAGMLQQQGLNPFLDKWNLVAGEPIEDGLIRALENSESAVIFVGPGGDGPWQSEEMRAILNRAVKSHNEFRAIPALLPNASADALKNSFLRSRLWIEFKSVDDADALMRLAKAIRGEASGGNSLKLPDEPAPYRGLERFERIEKPEEDFFFGRDEEIRALVGRLVKERFVAVVGASGSGKSSLVRAGLTKQLAEDIHPGIRRWTTITVEPGGAPFRSLAIQIAVAAGIPAADRERWIEQPVEKWTAAPDGVRQTVEALFADAKEPLLIFIDQFEELFTHRLKGPESDSLARTFVANLADLWRNGGDRVRVAMALRADFVARCLEIGPLKELLQDHTMLVGEVGDDALREIVKEPAARVGAFLEKGLMERILKDVRSGSGSLPLLQQALHGLWRDRTGSWLTHDAYTNSGGVARALNDQAQAAFEALDDDGQKAIANSLFPRLITLGEGMADTRRRVKRSELYPQGFDPDAVNEVIDRLSGKDARILVTTRAGGKAEDLAFGEDFVEFTHEALLSNWEHLIELLKTERASIRRHRDLTTAAAEWESKPDDERQKFLLRSGQLIIAEQWAKGGNARMTDLEARFLKASTDERDAEEDRKAKVARRLKFLSIGATAAAIIAMVIGGFAVQQKEKAIESEKEARSSNRKAELRLATSLIDQGDALGLANQWGQAKESYTQASDMLAKLGSDTFPAQLGLWNAYEYSPPELLSVQADKNSVFGVAVGPDGRTVVSAGYDGNLKLWDLSTGTLIRAFPTNHGLALCVAFSKDGKKILSGGADGTATLWDAETGNKIRDLVGANRGAVWCVAFSSNAQLGVAGYNNGEIVLWHLEDGRPPLLFSGHHTAAVLGVAFSPDNHLVASGGQFPDKSARLWDANTGVQIWSSPNYSDAVFSVAFSPDGHRLLTSGDHTLKLWDVQSHQPLRTFAGHRGAVASVSFSRDGSLALSASYDHTVRVWDVATAEQRALFSGHGGAALSAALSPNQAVAVSADDKGVLNTWNTTPNEVLVLRDHSDPIESVAFSPDGLVAVSGARDDTLKFWDLATGQMLRSIDAHVQWIPSVPNDWIRSVAYAPAPNGRFVVLSGGFDGAVKLWDVATGQLVRTFGSDGQPVQSVALSRDGRLAMAGGEDNTAHVWEVATGREVAVFRGDGQDEVFSVAFSPDATLALSGYKSGVIRLWDVKSAHEIWKFTGHTYVVHSLAFSPDGQTFLSASWDNSLRLWDLNTRQELRNFGTQSDAYHSVAFSPDGAMAIAANSDGLKLWDVKSGNQIRSFDRHRAAVEAAAFSPKGDAWLSGSSDLTVMFWDFSRITRYGEMMPRVSDFIKRLQTNPDDPAALATLGEWYAFRGIDDQAIQFLTKARAQGATVSSLLIARCYWKLGAFRAARTEFQKARDAHEASNFYIDLCLNAIPNQRD